MSSSNSAKATEQERVCDGCFNRLIHEVGASTLLSHCCLLNIIMMM